MWTYWLNALTGAQGFSSADLDWSCTSPTKDFERHPDDCSLTFDDAMAAPSDRVAGGGRAVCSAASPGHANDDLYRLLHAFTLAQSGPETRSG